jgi:hypothetical protein
MGFTHLWAVLGGAAAIGLPLAVHWLTRPRPVRVGLSTLRFVQEAVRERRARHRLRDALVLAARVLAVACIALAFARPLLGTAAGGEAPAAVERVVVVDTSASMGAVARGVPALERARGVAAKYLERGDGLRADLILAGAKPHAVFQRPSSNLEALREELGQAQARPDPLNLAAAIAAAGDELAQAAGRRRELIIISDLQRTNWGTVDFSAIPADARIVVESVAAADPPENMAVAAVTVRGRPAAGRETAVEVEVANFGRAPRAAQVELRLDGRTYNLEQVCPPGGRARMTAPVTFAGKGVVAGEAALTSGDALAVDNRRAFVVDVRARPSYLLVTREAAAPAPTSSHFLERALAPLPPADAAGGQAGERVVRMAPGGMDAQALAEADAVVLARPGRLDAAATALLGNALRRGKSILYAAADPVDATNLGALARQAGADLRMPVEFLPPALGGAASRPAGAAGGGPAAGIRHDLTLAGVRRDDPVWAVFGDSLDATLNSLRFTAALSSRPVEGGLQDDLLATYSDRSAALVATRCGQGTLIVWNAELADSNVVSSGAFVPLVGELAARLIAGRPAAAVDAGGPLALALPADAGGPADLAVTGPDGKPVAQGRLQEEPGGLVWRLAAGDRTGVYQVSRNGQTLAAAAVVTPVEESDLASLPPDVLTGRLAGGRQITVRGAATAENDGPDRAWAWLAVVAAVALAAETLVLRVFRV